MTMTHRPGFALGSYLREARLAARLEQIELAERVGVSRSAVSNYETGKTEPNASTFVRWAQATGADLNWLAGGVADLNEKAPSRGGLGASLPDLDSNQEPADYRPAGEYPFYWLGVTSDWELVA
jgi:transcriptional regulator with XRE-family HTH domain